MAMWRNRNKQPQPPPDYWSQSIDWIDSCIPWECFRNFRRGRWLYRCRTWDTNISCGIFGHCCRKKRQDSFEEAHENTAAGVPDRDIQTSESEESHGCLCTSKSKHGPCCFRRELRSYAGMTSIPKRNAAYSKLLHGQHHESASNVEFPSNRCLNPVAFPRTNVNSTNGRLLSASRKNTLKYSSTEDRDSVVFFQGCCGYATFKPNCCTGHPYLSRCQSFSESLLSSKKDYEIVFFQGKCGYACFDSNCCRLWETIHYNMRDDSDGNESKCSSPTHSKYFQNHSESEMEIAMVDVHARETTITEFHREGNSQPALPELFVLSSKEQQRTSGPVGSKVRQGYLKHTNMKNDGIVLVNTDVARLKEYAESQFDQCQDSINMQNDKSQRMDSKKTKSESVCNAEGNELTEHESCNLKINYHVIERTSEREPQTHGRLCKNAENMSFSAVNSASKRMNDSEGVTVVVSKTVKQGSAASKISPKVSSEFFQQKLDEINQSKDTAPVLDVSTRSETVASETQSSQFENISSVAVDSTLTDVHDCKQTAAVSGDLTDIQLETSVKNENISFVSSSKSEILDCEQTVNELDGLPNTHFETSLKDENIFPGDVELMESDVKMESSNISDRVMQSLATEISFRAINAAMVECDNTENSAVCRSPQSRLTRQSERFQGSRLFEVDPGERGDVHMDGHDKGLLFVHLTVSPVFEYGSPSVSSVLIDSDSDENPCNENHVCDTVGSFGVRGLRKGATDGCIDSSTSCGNCMDRVHTRENPRDDLTKDSDLEVTSSESSESCKKCHVITEHTSDDSALHNHPYRVCVQGEGVDKTTNCISRKTKVINDIAEYRAKQKLYKKKKRIKSTLDRQCESIADVSKHSDYLQKSLKLIRKVNPDHKCYKKYERTTPIKSRTSKGPGSNDRKQVKKTRKRTKTDKVKCEAGKVEKKNRTAASKKTNCKPQSDQHGKHDGESVLSDTNNTANDDTSKALCSSLPEQLFSFHSQLTADNTTGSCQIDNMSISMETRSEESRTSETIMELSSYYFEDDTQKRKPVTDLKSQRHKSHSNHSLKGTTCEALNQTCKGNPSTYLPCYGEGPAKEDPPRRMNKRKQKEKASKNGKKKTQSKSMRTEKTATITSHPMILERETDGEDYVPGTSVSCIQLTTYKPSSNYSAQTWIRSGRREQFEEDMVDDVPLQSENASISMTKGSGCHDDSAQEKSSFVVMKDSLFCDNENDEQQQGTPLTRRKSQESTSTDLNQLRHVSPECESVEIVQPNGIPPQKEKCKGDEKRQTDATLTFQSDGQLSLNTDSSHLAEASSHIPKCSTTHEGSVTRDHVPISCRCKQLEKDQSQSGCSSEARHNTIQRLSGGIDPHGQMTLNPSRQAGQSTTSSTLTRRPPLSNCVPGRPGRDTDKCLRHQSRGHSDLLYDPRVDILVGESIVKALSDLTYQDLPVKTHSALCIGNVTNDPETSTHKLRPEKSRSRHTKHHTHVKTKQKDRSGDLSRDPKVRRCSVNADRESGSVLVQDFQIPFLKSDGTHCVENPNKSQKRHENTNEDVSRDKNFHEENYILLQKTENKTVRQCLSLDLDHTSKSTNQEKDCRESLVRNKERKTIREGIEDENGSSGNELFSPRKVSQRMLPPRPITSRGSEVPAPSSQKRNKKTKSRIPVPGHAVYVGSVKHPWINTQRSDTVRPEEESLLGHTQVISNGNGASESNSSCVAPCESTDNNLAINKQTEGTRDSGGRQQPSEPHACVDGGLIKHRSDVRRIHTNDSNPGTCQLGKSKKKPSRKRISPQKPDSSSVSCVADLSRKFSHDDTENQRLTNCQDGTPFTSVVNPEPRGTASAIKKAESAPHSHGSIDYGVITLGRNSSGAVTGAESKTLNDSSSDFSTDRQRSQRNVISSPVYENRKGFDPWIDVHEQPVNRDSDAAIKISGDTEILTIENIDFSSEAELFSEQLSILHDNENTGDSQGVPNDSQPLDAYIFSTDKRVARCASENGYIPPYDDNELSKRQNNNDYGYNICLNPHNSFRPSVTSASIPSRGYFHYGPSSRIRDRLAEEDDRTGILRPCRYSLESRLSIDIAEGIVNGRETDPKDTCVSDYVREYNELCKSSIDTERRILKSVLESVRGCYSSGSTDDHTLSNTQDHVGHLGGDCSESNQYGRNSCLIDSRSNDDGEELSSSLNLFQATDSDVGSNSGNNQHILSQKDDQGHVLFKAIAEETDEELRAELSQGLNRRVITGVRAGASLDRRKRLQRQKCVEEGSESEGITSKRIRQEGKKHPISQGKTRRDTRTKQSNANKSNQTASSGGVSRGLRTLKRPPLKNINSKLQTRKGSASTPDKADNLHTLNRHSTNPSGPRRFTTVTGNDTRASCIRGSEGARSQKNLDDVVVVEKERNERGGIVKKEKRCKTKRKISHHDKDGQSYTKSTVTVKSEDFEGGVIAADDSVGFTPKPEEETFSQNMSYRNRKDSRGTRDRERWSGNDNNYDRFEDVTEGRTSAGKLSRYSDSDPDVQLRKSPRYDTHDNEKREYDGGRFEDVTDDVDEVHRAGKGRRHPRVSRGDYTAPELSDDSVRRGANSFIKEKVASDEEYVSMIAQGKISFLQDLEGWREAYDLDSDVIEAEARKLMAGDLRNLYRDLPERDRREVVRNIEYMDSLTHDDLIKSLRT